MQKAQTQEQVPSTEQRVVIDDKPVLSIDAESDVYVVKFNSDGNYIMSGHTDRTVKLWNATKGTPIKTYAGVHNREIFDLAIFSDNNRFASCGGDQVFYIWDVLSGRYLRKITAHQSRINTLALNPLETVIATGSFDSSVKLWDLQSQQYKPIQVLDDFKDSVTKVIFTECQIVCACVDGYLRTYDIRMGKLLKDNLSNAMNSLDLSLDRKYALASCLNSQTLLYDLELGEILKTYTGSHKSSEFHGSVLFSHDQSSVIQASEDGRIAVYGVEGGLKRELRGHKRAVVGIDRHPKRGGTVVSGSADGTIRVWEMPNKQK
ncbi:hypothetical protein FGO68_gene7083 [Halteria grandinella]|uniref:Uncharacterized protein n=1 Tax=Halteria grandinella TaxID=5974 RepID=A0A8J8NRL2_HALGN|nr:hypothetical protein FGO68_gene7083 [Halteria grandinella]